MTRALFVHRCVLLYQIFLLRIFYAGNDVREYLRFKRVFIRHK